MFCHYSDRLMELNSLFQLTYVIGILLIKKILLDNLEIYVHAN